MGSFHPVSLPHHSPPNVVKPLQHQLLPSPLLSILRRCSASSPHHESRKAATDLLNLQCSPLQTWTEQQLQYPFLSLKQGLCVLCTLIFTMSHCPLLSHTTFEYPAYHVHPAFLNVVHASSEQALFFLMTLPLFCFNLPMNPSIGA